MGGIFLLHDPAQSAPSQISSTPAKYTTSLSVLNLPKIKNKLPPTQLAVEDNKREKYDQLLSQKIN
jgi:hypothetical protein